MLTHAAACRTGAARKDPARVRPSLHRVGLSAPPRGPVGTAATRVAAERSMNPPDGRSVDQLRACASHASYNLLAANRVSSPSSPASHPQEHRPTTPTRPTMLVTCEVTCTNRCSFSNPATSLSGGFSRRVAGSGQLSGALARVPAGESDPPQGAAHHQNDHLCDRDLLTRRVRAGAEPRPRRHRHRRRGQDRAVVDVQGPPHGALDEGSGRSRRTHGVVARPDLSSGERRRAAGGSGPRGLQLLFEALEPGVGLPRGGVLTVVQEPEYVRGCACVGQPRSAPLERFPCQQ